MTLIDRDTALKNFANSQNFSKKNFKDIEVESLWDSVKNGKDNTNDKNSLQKTKYDSNNSEHKKFLTAVVYKIIDSPNHKGDRNDNKDDKYTDSTKYNDIDQDILDLIFVEALDVAQKEYGATTLSNIENAILRIMERYDDPNDGNRGNTNCDTGSNNTVDDGSCSHKDEDIPDDNIPPVQGTNLYKKSDIANQIYEKTTSYQKKILSQEILNETADAYFDNVLGTVRANQALSRFYTDPDYADYETKLLSDLDENSYEIQLLKYDLQRLLGDDYDDDTANIIVQAARKNLSSNTTATLEDLYDEIDAIIQGTSTYTADDSDDVRNISKDFGSIGDLFYALANTTLDLDMLTYDEDSQEYRSIQNQTVDIPTVKAFLEGYFDGMLESYIDELLTTADTTGNGSINIDEFTQILRKLNDDLDGNLGLGKTDDVASTITGLKEDLENYTFTQNNTEITMQVPLNLTTEHKSYTDYRLSPQLSKETIGTYFANIDDTSKTFSVPASISPLDKVVNLIDNYSITNKLMTDFNISLDMAELIIHTATQDVLADNPNATVTDLCSKIVELINSSPIQTMDYNEPNIEEDFGSINDLFMVLINSTLSQYDNTTEDITMTFDYLLDKDVLASFIASYTNMDIDTILNNTAIPDKINLSEFYVLLGLTDKVLENQDKGTLGISTNDQAIIDNLQNNITIDDDGTTIDDENVDFKTAVAQISNALSSVDEDLIRNVLSVVSDSGDNASDEITTEQIIATQAIIQAWSDTTEESYTVSVAGTDYTVSIAGNDYTVTVGGTEYKYTYDETIFET